MFVRGGFANVLPKRRNLNAVDGCSLVLYFKLFKDNLKAQNLLIVISSYVFYGWWDWRFLLLIIFSTLIDFFVGNRLSKEENQLKRKVLLWLSVGVNLGVLGLFKYYNFFIENFVAAFSFFGNEITANSLNIILPVGISFYTFQTLSYSIDIYKCKLKPTNDIVAFSAFVCFFPQLVAGPIERATHLLPQFKVKRTFDYFKAVDGMRQILWGFFKKVVIADNCAGYVNLMFDNPDAYSGSTLLIGGALFAFQIYGDFSGYSDMAIGLSRLLGFDLKQNFVTPYFSRNFAEVSWFRDYVYIPLGGSLGSTWMKVRNVLIVFLLSSLWHGANWTFIVWGIIHALLFMPSVFKKNKQRTKVVAEGKKLPSIMEALAMTRTFFLWVLVTIFFRAESVKQAGNYVSGIFSSSLFSFEPHVFGRNGVLLTIFICFFMIIEWLGREDKYALEKLTNNWRSVKRYLFYYFILFLIFFYGGQPQDFIYFQF